MAQGKSGRSEDRSTVQQRIDEATEARPTFVACGTCLTDVEVRYVNGVRQATHHCSGVRPPVDGETVWVL